MTREDRYTLFTEARSREDNVMGRFKSKYHFVPDNSGANNGKGTITVNGKQYKCDIGKSKIVEVDNGQCDDVMIDRNTCAVLNGQNVIIIHPSFWRLKSDGERHAVLMHEIGHLNLHDTTAGAKNMQVDKEIVQNITTSVIKDMGIIQYIGKDAAKSARNEMVKTALDYAKKNKLSTNDKSDQAKIRKECMRYLNTKYKSQKPHHSTMEAEADLYAKNHSNAKDLKRGLRHATKQQLKSTGKKIDNSQNIDKKDKEFTKKNMNKLNQSDLKRRDKILNDKNLKDKAKKAYK